MRPFLFLLLLALSGCFFPTTQVPYEPHPEQIRDPLGVLKETIEAQHSCAKGYDVALVGHVVRYTSRCEDGNGGARERTDVDLDFIVDIRIELGDWAQIVLVRRQGKEDDPAVLRADSPEAARRVADALLALRDSSGAAIPQRW